MPKSFIVAPLGRDRTDQAFPVMQAVRGEDTLDRWRTRVDGFRALAPEGGIMACTTGGGHIRGLFLYRVGGDGTARVLGVPAFVAVGLFDSLATAAALAEAAERLASKLGCGSVAVDAQGCALGTLAPPPDAAGLFGRLGYRDDGRCLVKDLPGRAGGTGGADAPPGAAFAAAGAA